MPLEPVITALSARFERVRAGLDVGFSDEDFIARLHAARRGNWLSIPSSDIFPFEASQFDAVVLESQAVTREAVDLALRPQKPKKFFSHADSTGAEKAVFLGPDDVAKGVARMKDLATREEKEICL